MKRVLVAAALALAFAGSSLAPVEAKPKARYVEMFDRLTQAVERNFYDPHFNGQDWNALKARYRRRLNDVRTDEAFYRLGTDLLGELRRSHLDLRMPEEVRAGTASVAIKLRRIGADWVVTEVDPLSDARRQGIRPGAVLLSSPDDLRGTTGSLTSVRTRTCSDEERLYSVRREKAFWPPEKPDFRWSRISTAPDRSIGYIKALRFDDGSAELADQAMEELKDTDGLIIDIRENSGGNTSALRLASYFTEGAGPSIILLTRPYLDRIGRPVTARDTLAAPRIDRAYTTEAVLRALTVNNGGAAFWTDDVGAKRYTKPVVVLINENTASAAEGFAWHMRLKTHAVIMGRRSAGALLGGERFDIGYGWSVTVPTQGIWAPDGQSYADRPVAPQVVVPQSRADLCAGRDQDIEEAIDRLAPR